MRPSPFTIWLPEPDNRWPWDLRPLAVHVAWRATQGCAFIVMTLWDVAARFYLSSTSGEIVTRTGSYVMGRRDA